MWAHVPAVRTPRRHAHILVPEDEDQLPVKKAVTEAGSKTNGMAWQYKILLLGLLAIQTSGANLMRKYVKVNHYAFSPEYAECIQNPQGLSLTMAN